MKTQFVETLSRSASTPHIIPQLLAVVNTFSKPSLDVENSYSCLYTPFVLNLGMSNEVLEGALFL